MRVGLIAAALVAVAVAGCSETPPEQGEDTEFQDVDVKATRTTGVIRGIVVDKAIVPVPDATVSIVGRERSTITNEAGAFGFEGLEPGTYFLKVNKEGWQEAQANADVVAGKDAPPVVKVLLQKDPTTQPYVTSDQYDVYIECAVTAVLVGYNGPCPNEYYVEYHAGELGRTPEFAQTEMAWKSTQVAGEWMSLLYSAPRAGQTLLYNYQDIEGPSPLTAQANRSLMEENGVINSYPLQIRVFGTGMEGTDIGRDYGDPTDGDDCLDRPVLGQCMHGVGVVVDQRLTAYSHFFFNFEPDLEWRFVVDGPPEIPET